MAAVGWNM